MKLFIPTHKGQLTLLNNPINPLRDDIQNSQVFKQEIELMFINRGKGIAFYFQIQPYYYNEPLPHKMENVFLNFEFDDEINMFLMNDNIHHVNSHILLYKNSEEYILSGFICFENPLSERKYFDVFTHLKRKV